MDSSIRYINSPAEDHIVGRIRSIRFASSLADIETRTAMALAVIDAFAATKQIDYTQRTAFIDQVEEQAKQAIAQYDIGRLRRN